MPDNISNNISGKNAVITGSTSGIGLAIAQSLAARGANIMLNGFGDKDDIESIRSDIESKGVKCLYHPADMTKPDQIADLIATSTKELGSIDILVNNAGIQFVSPIQDFPQEKWDAIIAINLSAAFHTIKHSVPHMKTSGWGRIINICSAHGLVASPFKSAYVAAKHGILGMTKSVALEVAEDNITVNAICPGYVKTPLVEGQIADTAKARNMSEDEVVRDVLLKAQHTKKFVQVEDIAAYVNFLCSDAAANITGAAQTIDGGWTAA
jgi:3-hydroxybutyrate dehydrogenase